MYMQAILESAPMGLELRTTEVEKILGDASADELDCEHNNTYTDWIVHYLYPQCTQVMGYLSLELIVSVKRLSICVIYYSEYNNKLPFQKLEDIVYLRYTPSLLQFEPEK